LTGIVVGTVLTLAVAGCGAEEYTTISHNDPPPVGLHDDPDQATEVEEEPPPLTKVQLERYYVAQVSWHDCVSREGVALSEPPPLEEFLADGGAWSAGSDLSGEEWNRLFGGNRPSRVGTLCGEPPFESDFRVGREAMERLFAWQLEVVACLAVEGFPLEQEAPSIEDFVRTAGTNWVPVREFDERYGYLEGGTWVRVYTRCGNDNQDMWLRATDFEIDRAELKAQYEANVALAACLEGGGFSVPPAPPLREFIDELGENWSHADIWGAGYRDNDRKAVSFFAEGIDQACPGAS
jgi:hypothetical protein